MEVPLLLQFSIALLTGMVASTFVPPVRRSIPRPVEIAMWIGLATVCLLGILSVTDKNARELTTAAAWGADQIINTLIGLLGAGIAAWISDHRFAIATAVVILAGIDLVALALIRSIRTAERAQPRVRLRDWMELPLPSRQHVPAPASAFDTINRRFAAGVALATAALLTAALNATIWLRDVVLLREAKRLGHAAARGRVQSKAGLESLRDRAAHLRFAAHAWYAAAGAPAVNGLATRATEAVRSAGVAGRAGQTTDLVSGRMADIHVLLSAQSIGWYGPLSSAPDIQPEGEEDGVESQPDRLAS